MYQGLSDEIVRTFIILLVAVLMVGFLLGWFVPEFLEWLWEYMKPWLHEITA